MSSTSPLELTASVVIARIESGEYPRDVIVTVARGFLPLPQEDLVAILAYLTASHDAEIASLASASLGDIPTRVLMEFAANETAEPVHLERLLRATSDPVVLEALIRNRVVSDSAIVALAGRANADIQEVIVINQARILRAPEILDALLGNPNLSADARRRAMETREEFFEKKARIQKALEEAAAAALLVAEDEVAVDLPVDAIADLLAMAEADPGAAVPPVELSEPEKEDPKKLSIWAQVLVMTVSEKVQLAFKGGKTERSILIRDRNKLICSAVVRNPRLSDGEIESFASMRNIDEEVLRLITTRRDWMSKYSIVQALARNPKTPIGVVLPMINRLTLRDLKSLKDDRNVSETVRQIARKAFLQRSQKS
ncbi:MAG TPA: hypothetical protein VEZ11_14460 [Thermoanaerobaculia bacterium]|nr:hypothetical protein [Thermoanaerobaculia bacterium]